MTYRWLADRRVNVKPPEMVLSLGGVGLGANEVDKIHPFGGSEEMGQFMWELRYRIKNMSYRYYSRTLYKACNRPTIVPHFVQFTFMLNRCYNFHHSSHLENFLIWGNALSMIYAFSVAFRTLPHW